MTALAAVPGPLETYASEIDVFTFGEHAAGEARPAFRGELQPSVGRYHLYLSWASLPSHHTAILRSLLGLEGMVSLSYVDSLRDGRGWAFRSRTGPDPVNGFTLLREAYLASDPGYAGEVRVPLLWDRVDGAITSDDPESIAAGLLARGGSRLATGAAVEAEVARLRASFATDLDAVAALRDPARRSAFGLALSELDRRLGGRRYVVGAALSDADVRLWVRLARFDAGPNASGMIGPRLDQYPNLWRWATELYALPAFAANTEFARFAAPFASLPPWSAEGDGRAPVAC